MTRYPKLTPILVLYHDHVVRFEFDLGSHWGSFWGGEFCHHQRCRSGLATFLPTLEKKTLQMVWKTRKSQDKRQRAVPDMEEERQEFERIDQNSAQSRFQVDIISQMGFSNGVSLIEAKYPIKFRYLH